MGGSGSSGGSGTQTTKNQIAPELKPLFGQTGTELMRLQGMAPMDPFLGVNPQQIPGATPGQMDILGAQRTRAFGEPLTTQEQQAQMLAGNFGQMRAPEQSAYNLSQNFGQLRMPENFGLLQAAEFAGGPMGSAPATQAAMAAVRDPVLNDLALAGLGNSTAVGSNLGAAYAPILAQEMAIKAGIIPQLFGLGQNLRGGDIAAGGLQAGLGERMRAGDVAGAQRLAQLGATVADRQSQLLSEYGTSEEATRKIAEAQQAAAYQDFLRRQQISQSLTTGLLSSFPNIGGSQVTRTNQSGGGTAK